MERVWLGESDSTTFEVWPKTFCISTEFLLTSHNVQGPNNVAMNSILTGVHRNPFFVIRHPGKRINEKLRQNA